MEILVPIVGFIVFYYIVSVISDNRLRRLIVEKGEVNENLKELFASRRRSIPSVSLKWGLVLLAVGLALFLANFLAHLGIGSDELTFGLMFIFGGAAMVAYYFIAEKLEKPNEK